MALGLGDEVYAGLASSLQAKRDLLCEGAARRRAAGDPARRDLLRHRRRRAARGRRTRWRSAAGLPALAGVVGVPVSVFHDDADAARTLVRFAFCKRDEVLHEAVSRLAALSPG